MIKAFKMNDIDGDDLLSSEEVKALLTNFNEEFTDEEIDESIKAADKGGLISEGILPLVPLPKKGAKSLPWAENLNKLFTEKLCIQFCS